MNTQPDTRSPMTASLPEGPLSSHAVEAIHGATLDLLAATGIWCGSRGILDLARDHGLVVDDGRVRFTPEQIDQALETTAREVTLIARNPDKTVTLTRGASLIGMGRSAPFITLAGGRHRTATAADYLELTRLGQALDEIQLPGPLAFPGDLPADRLYPFIMAGQVRYTDKPYCLIHETDIDLLLKVFELSPADLEAGPDSGRAWGQTTVNTQSPLALSRDQGDYLLAMARCGIPIAVSPTPAAGSSGPCSIAGNLVLNNAEVLGTLVLIQLARPGLAVLYGTFPSGSDMRSMAATYAGPESRKMEAAAARMARRYGLLTRGNTCLSDAQEIDFQAGAESMFNLVEALSSGISYLPGCGIAGGFATASREKLILDADLVAMARHYLSPVSTDGLDQVLDLIKRIGPKGSYITDPHTFKGFRTELHHPTVFSRISSERWVKRGRSLLELASARADTLLKAYVRPELDPVLDRHLESFL